ncbi:MAG: O-antigen ligase family protein [Candidatus Faecivicinus sp.]
MAMMKNLMARLRGLSERNVLLLLLMLAMSFGMYISHTAGCMLLGGPLLLWSAGMAYPNLRNRELRQSAAFRWALASWAVFFVTMTAASMKSGLESEQIFIVCMSYVFSIFVMFPQHPAGKREIRREFMLLGETFACAYLPFELLALASVFTGRVMHLPLINGAIGIQSAGAVSDRIVIFMNTNGVSECAALIILFSIYAIMNHPNRLCKAFFAFDLLVNVMVLAHTQSRTSIIALSAALALVAFRAVWLRPELRRLCARLAAGLAAAILAFFAVLNGTEWIYRMDIGIAADKATGEVVSRADAVGQFDVGGTGRGEIWSGSIQYLRDHPEKMILGMGLERIEKIAEEHSSVGKYSSLHNSLLECLATSGLPMVICIAGLLCALFCPALRMWLAPKDPAAPGMFLIPVAVAMLLTVSLTESVLFINPRQVNFFFYLLGGYILQHDAIIKRAKDAGGEIH